MRPTTDQAARHARWRVAEAAARDVAHRAGLPSSHDDPAVGWLVRRHRVRPVLAARVAELAGLGGRRHG